ncbi:methyl-accepting chemotaxis protein [Neptunomonas japonica]|uniref:methyl-accepting chemotaxis protein n=1 Tax=Neptunomonas japonica TaxID=417574 RepID=UPI00041A4361|nr:HAMP domain-containing methyl-accepting chemotaxis protein [Neptunomonas japonica]
MDIRSKLLMLVAFMIISTLIMFGLQRYTIYNIELFDKSIYQVSELESNMLLLRRHEKDFLARSDRKYIAKFNNSSQQFDNKISNIKKDLSSLSVSSESMDQLSSILQIYNKSFNELAQKKIQIGLDQNSGLRGSLRSSVKLAEGEVRELLDYKILSEILQLRRNEKDFLLRKDLKYLDKFSKNYSKIKLTLKNSGIPQTQLAGINKKLDNYQRDFLALVKTYEEVGLNSKSGLLGGMRKTIHQSEEVLADTVSYIIEVSSEKIESLKTLSIIISIVIGLISSGFALYIAISIIRPLAALNGVMSKARENKDLTLEFHSNSKDEITTMGQSFNNMMNEFKALMSEVNNSSIQLSSAAEEVSSIAVETAQGLDSQRDEVLQVASAINEMNGAMVEISKNTDMTAATAQESQTSAVKSQKIIEKAIADIELMASEAELSSAAISKLEEESNAICSVLEVIKGIAEQTNLLALNAAIEAARAGDSGRGFAVVADEVRALAARTQSSTVEIDAMISSLQQQTEIVAVMTNKSVELSRISAQGAADSIDSLNVIMTGAEHIVDMTAQVATAVEEQSAVASTITMNTDRIKDIVELSSEQVGQNSLASEDVAKQATLLHSVISKFKTV